MEQLDRKSAGGDGDGLLASAGMAALASAPVLRPVTFRSVPREGQDAGERCPSRTWVDRALLIAEWLVAATLILYVVYRIEDGPVQDWLHQRTPAAVPAPPERAPVPRPMPRPIQHSASRQANAVHPELGRSLPSDMPDQNRPGGAVDYLVPALRYVPPAPPKPQPIVAVAPAVPPPDLRPTRLQARAAGIDTPVVEVFLKDGTWQVADYAAGYLHGSGLPGQGNLVMAAHKGIRGSIFAHLERLKPGDDIFVDAAGRRFHYQVRTTGNVWPSDVTILYPTPTPTLTLLTCTNWDTQRFVVMADLVDSAALSTGAGD